MGARAPIDLLIGGGSSSSSGSGSSGISSHGRIIALNGGSTKGGHVMFVSSQTVSRSTANDTYNTQIAYAI